jgi:hypothetical protein
MIDPHHPLLETAEYVLVPVDGEPGHFWTLFLRDGSYVKDWTPSARQA